jgi:pimeloyl-ACP methyl ester carboxylesterase
LCAIVDRQPETATSVMSSLRALSGQAGSAGDGEPRPEDVVALIDRELAAEVLRPFETASRLVRYARQVLDFASRDVAQDVARIKVPVLVVGAEHDRVTAPAMSRALARQMPHAIHVELRGATHYCMYDSPHRVAALIDTFFHDPDALR